MLDRQEYYYRKLLYAGAAPHFHGCLGLAIVMQTQFLYRAGAVLPNPLWQALEETMDFLLPSFLCSIPKFPLRK